MSEDADEWPPEGVEHGLYADHRVAQGHPVPDGPDGFAVEELLRLAGPGDRILWPGRKQPLEVVGQEYEVDRYVTDGYWEAEGSLEVNGSRGATYRVANWWHRNSGVDQHEVEAGDRTHHKCYPQVYRTTDDRFESEGKLNSILVVDDGYWHADDDIIEGDPVERVVFERPTPEGSALAWGSVDRYEFGQPVVEVIQADGVEPVAIERDWIVAYRTEVSMA